MVATASRYHDEHPTVTIKWQARSLKDFGMESVQDLARRYDFIVIDHPHAGTIAEANCVLPLDSFLSEAELAELAEGSPGRSHQSYQWVGHQWALAIDAACQTSACRPDLLSAFPRTWDEVIALADDGRVLWPLCGVDSAASFLTLAVSLGSPCGQSQSAFVERGVGRGALALMREVATRSDPRCLDDNPIAVLEAMAHSDDFVYSPLSFCYLNYSGDAHQGAKLNFGDIPSVDGSSARGALLGGAGLAVSAYSEHPEEAVAYAKYVASPAVQRDLYFQSGGQPAHVSAWDSKENDVASGGFFSGVRPTIDASWTRPTAPSFADFQNEMIGLFDDWFERSERPDEFLDQLDDVYRETMR
jgi:multiple sugar transport system substrate-binding protein